MNTKVNEGKLISGKDVLIALANGKEVEAYVEYEANLHEWQNARELTICDVLDSGFIFRLKPRTITINGIEMPAPFEPKEYEDCYMLTDLYEHGYTRTSWKYSKSVPAWRTEEEIKQVVTALRFVLTGGWHEH